MALDDAQPATARLLMVARVMRAILLLMVGGAAAIVANRWIRGDAAGLPDHSLFGALAGIALLVEALLRLFALLAGAPSSPLGAGARAFYVAFCVFLLCALGAGYLTLATASPAPSFLGIAIAPIAPDIPLSHALANTLGITVSFGAFGDATLGAASGNAHRIFAIAAIAAGAGYLVALILQALRPSPEVVVAGALPALAGATPPEAEAFGGRLRFTGWLIFWVQLFISVTSGLMFQLAQPGRANLPREPWFREPIGWGGVALGVMLFSLALAYIYTRMAKRIAAHPEKYLDPRRLLGQWFLTIGIFLGFIGVFTSFTGLAMSVWMLIGKIVSQPPGIAITDPTNFIRMLDMLILIANIALLMGHVLGAGATQWLRIHASKARLDMLHAVVAAPQKREAPPAAEKAAQTT